MQPLLGFIRSINKRKGRIKERKKQRETKKEKGKEGKNEERKDEGRKKESGKEENSWMNFLKTINFCKMDLKGFLRLVGLYSKG